MEPKMKQSQIPRCWDHWTSRIALLSLALFASVPMDWSQSSSVGIRSVDFKNFTYPWLDPHGWPNRMQWISPTLKSKIQLVNGQWDQRDEADKASNQEFEGLTYEDINYASFTPDSAESAIVVLRYDSGGPPFHFWVYIYGFANNEPELMGFFHAGDRSFNGLYRVFEKDHLLNVELFDPDLKEGECCSAGYIDFLYRWNGTKFQVAGKTKKGIIDPSAKRNVSIFGLPLPIPHK
jgi:hypothetical protein